MFRVIVLVAALYLQANAFMLEGIGGNNKPTTASRTVETATTWRNQAKANIRRLVTQQPNVGVAKNVILFLGDGMSIPTVTAGRILKGQLEGHSGEETQLSFDKFPVTGLSKTYCQDTQVTDSAASATAYLCGVKTNKGTVGVDGHTNRGDCPSQSGNDVTSILDWSMAAGKSVGIVTTTRVTHATPAGTYANVADRDWEGDHYTAGIDGGCRDIATQLIDDYPQIQVILGGGRQFFMRYDQMDPEHGSNVHYGRRDGRDLIEDWKSKQASMGRSHHYVWNASAFNDIDPQTTDSIMGLFESSHMNYDYERKDPDFEVAGEPSLAEMTDKAIKILSKNPNGFFLLVEGGRIDMAHHAGIAKLALHELVAFQDAVAKGDELTNENDTLIITTADHSHTMAFAGYAERGNDILGKVQKGGRLAESSDGKPYTTLLYGNGPGYAVENGSRPDITHTNTNDDEYHQQAAVPLASETHGGEDVGIWSRGPMSYLLAGVHEQNDIAHVMAYASCVGDYTHECAASLRAL